MAGSRIAVPASALLLLLAAAAIPSVVDACMGRAVVAPKFTQPALPFNKTTAYDLVSVLHLELAKEQRRPCWCRLVGCCPLVPSGKTPTAAGRLQPAARHLTEPTSHDPCNISRPACSSTLTAWR